MNELLLKFSQRISSIPSIYQSLYDTVMDCNKEFDTVIRRAEATFTTDTARRALDEWINVVKEAALEIRNAYSKSKAGEASPSGTRAGR